MTIKGLLIPADQLVPLSIVHVENDWQALAEAIGCQWIERIRITKDVSYVVDDEGLLTGQPVNVRANHLMYPGALRGDVLVFNEHMTRDGAALTDLTDEYLIRICHFLDVPVPTDQGGPNA